MTVNRRWLLALAVAVASCGPITTSEPVPSGCVRVGGKTVRFECSTATPIPVMTTLAPRPTHTVSRSRSRTVYSGGARVEGSDVWARLAACESSNGRDSSNGKYHGYFQVIIETWRSHGGGPRDPHTYTYEEQREIAIRIWRDRGWQPWPACSRKLGLR